MKKTVQIKGLSVTMWEKSFSIENGPVMLFPLTPADKTEAVEWVITPIVGKVQKNMRIALGFGG